MVIQNPIFITKNIYDLYVFPSNKEEIDNEENSKKKVKAMKKIFSKNITSLFGNNCF